MQRSSVLAVLVLSLATLSTQGQQQPAPDPYKPVLDRLQAITTLPLTKWKAINADMPHGEVPYGETPAEPTGGGALSFPTQSAYQQDLPLPVWLYSSVEVAQAITGFSVAGSRIALDLGIGSNTGIMITVFVNHNMVSRGDQDSQVPITLTQSAVPGQKLLIAMRILSSGLVGCCGGPHQVKLDKAELFFTPPEPRPDPTILRQEIMAAELLIAAYPDGKAERQQQLDAAVKAVDLGALDKGDQAAFDASLKAAQGKLDVLRPYMKQFTVKAVGNSHIDMAWLWPETETVEVVRNTFGTALQLMREYPDFKFAGSAAQAYVWMEEKYPAIFREIEQRVKEDRWEIVGGMWVEPDLNMPDGESLVRQILYGKRYFKQKFDVDVNVGWNPDSFGYNWQLPQIYKRSGIDYFVTQKLLWASEFTKFPYRLFWWQAPDGSCLMTYFPSDYGNAIEPVRMARDSSVYGPMMWKYNGGTNSAPAGGLQMMYLYGVGDHGGGPTRTDLDTALRWQKPDVVFPKLEFSTAASFLNNLSKNESELNLPTWTGELYFQYHRGVQTTQSETKRGNRKSEVALLDAEKLASIGTLFGETYPQADFDASWKKVLFNQFHDVLPGSGIAINYVDAARKYAEVQRFSNDTIHNSLSELAARVDFPPNPGLISQANRETFGEVKIQGVASSVGVLVFNPLSWTRFGPVEFDVQFPTPIPSISAMAPNGKQIEAHLVSEDTRTGLAHVLMIAEDLPANGYNLYLLLGSDKRLVDIPGAIKPEPRLKATDTSLENEFLRVQIDSKTGCITSLFDKRTNTEALAAAVAGIGAPANLPDGKPCGNLLQAFVDKPQKWDAWNVDANFIEHHTDLLQADEVKLIESTPLRAVIRVTHKWQNSSFVQDITLCAGMPRVDVHMQADWHEKHILLKVAFPLSARNDKATFEIPYGTVERPTTRNTPAEKAQFEVPALRWADLSDATHGFSLLNDSKYGYDAKDNVLRLSLLRAPEYPDPNADQGHHEFTYSLYPHAGTWRDALTVRQGYEVNVPLLAVTTTRHQGTLPPSQSFFVAQEDNVVITAIKKDADDNSLIVRFYEWAGKKGDVHLTLPQAASAAWQTNLMEVAPSPLSLDASGKVVTVPTNAYEIKTVKVQFAK
ncbi:MAG TPA: glycoside hydrolase family 38 C-terminal domain-containing protein [Terriglobales bacterium]